MDSTFIITLNTYNSSGCKTTYSDNFSPQPLPIVDFDSIYFCRGQENTVLNRTTISDNTPLTYEWRVNDEIIATDRDGTFLLDTENELERIKLISTSFIGCKDSTSKLITIATPPQAQMEISENCFGSPTSFADVSTGDQEISSWSWFTDNATINSQNAEYTYNSADTFSVQLIVEDILNCIDTVDSQIIINSLPELSFEHDIACEGAPTSFVSTSTAPGDSITEIQWTVLGASTILSGDSASTVFTDNGSKLIQLSIQTKNGCDLQFIDAIEVYEKPTSLFEFDSYTAAPESEILTYNSSSDACLLYTSPSPRDA